MLLSEIHQPLLETNLTHIEVAWIKPSTGQIVQVDDQYHLHALAENPELFGVDRNRVERDISRFKDVDEWADNVDNVFSIYHEMAYSSGWVRWRRMRWGTKTEIGMSGIGRHVIEALSMPAVVNAVRYHIEYHGAIDFHVEWKVSQLGETRSDGGWMYTIAEFNELRRKLSS